MKTTLTLIVATALILTLTVSSSAAEDQTPADKLLAGRFNWTISEPLVAPAPHPTDPRHAVKDPTVVRYNGKWHVFCTIRSKIHRPQIEYFSFADWQDANAATRYELGLAEKIPEAIRGKDKYLCAPQVFYFEPHKKWYLIYQMVIKLSDTQDKMVPGYSTTTTIDDPNSWSNPTPLCNRYPEWSKGGLDFWVICDEQNAYLFYTSLNGLMWRSEIPLADFPSGRWTPAKTVLEGDIFEASHIYRLKGMDKYLAVIEAEAHEKRRRYQKAYVADSLDGKWVAVADTKEHPFAGPVNIKHTGDHWTDSISHGEMLRAGYNQLLEVDPANLQYLFQGASDADIGDIGYGAIPWRHGILTSTW
jgi:hypothetical protein